MRITNIGTQIVNSSNQVSFKDERRNKTPQGQEDNPQNTSGLNFASTLQNVEPAWKQVSKIAQKYLDGLQIASFYGLR